MSLKLAFSDPQVSCKSMSKFDGKGFLCESFSMGDYNLNKDDFVELILYFMTNTDLEEDDCRLGLIGRINGLRQVEGYNAGNTRLE